MAEQMLTNVFSLLIIGILWLGINLQNPTKDASAKRFLILLYAIAAYSVVNIFSELIEGNNNLVALSYILNTATFFAVDFVVIAFCGYLHPLLAKVNRENAKILNMVVGICFFRMCIVLLLTISGHLFTMENGFYVEKDLVAVPYVLSGIIMILLLLIVIINRDCFTKRELTVIILYLVLPVPPIAIELYTNLYSLTGVSLTLSVLFIYVFIQASAIEQSRLRETVLEELSNKDLLTGLFNRRAYYNRITELEPMQNVGVLFCDINGLKYTNDHFGHAAGDALIQRFSGLLIDFFGKSDVYRISGDEFIVLIPHIEDEAFMHSVEAFRSAVSFNESIAAVGYSIGIGCRIEQLVGEAEKLMYKEKTLIKQQK